VTFTDSFSGFVCVSCASADGFSPPAVCFVESCVSDSGSESLLVLILVFMLIYEELFSSLSVLSSFSSLLLSWLFLLCLLELPLLDWLLLFASDSLSFFLAYFLSAFSCFSCSRFNSFNAFSSFSISLASLSWSFFVCLSSAILNSWNAN